MEICENRVKKFFTFLSEQTRFEVFSKDQRGMLGEYVKDNIAPEKNPHFTGNYDL